MTTDSKSPAPAKPITLTLDQLPVGLRQQTIADAENDARHLSALIDSAVDKLNGLILPDDFARHGLNSAMALLWVARDQAELLEWKLERMDRARELAR